MQMREDKDRHRPIQRRIGKTSTKISGYIDMAKNKMESYVSMNANCEQSKLKKTESCLMTRNLFLSILYHDVHIFLLISEKTWTLS